MTDDKREIDSAGLGTLHPPGPRFFIDHGQIHDRETGKHVTTDEDSVFNPGISECLELLNMFSSELDEVQANLRGMNALYQSLVGAHNKTASALAAALEAAALHKPAEPQGDDDRAERLNKAADIMDARIGNGHDRQIIALLREVAKSLQKSHVRGVQIPEAAIVALRDHQQQADMDGTMVTVSRQAIDEVLTYVALRQSHNTRGEVVEEPLPSLSRKCRSVAAIGSHMLMTVSHPKRPKAGEMFNWCHTCGGYEPFVAPQKG